eukprot:CAMPEP_0170521474 /NCGR_PEP_ID=MMETSP0209-20121228/6833_1 /TAXON_ID=665100 ORGANISM="Litonotus pictus, Strain P1" /NCGR_SAMPLE_ID=MMETSP0209 /ASSEMBLY_ACC=CAM_ASM_000301 /LENGTH=57 /DNA_ID=CAMNT_0010808361 /DNA_START=402 /DNA_END=575 /DNA_ORIENTATION=+
MTQIMEEVKEKNKKEFEKAERAARGELESYVWVHPNDVLDFTMVEDWKCYLYWIGLY